MERMEGDVEKKEVSTCGSDDNTRLLLPWEMSVMCDMWCSFKSNVQYPYSPT
jgi:hypothetical protein